MERPKPERNEIGDAEIRPDEARASTDGSKTLADGTKTIADEQALAGGKFPLPVIPSHELIARVGQGSYDEVWLARNIMGTYRAVKIVYRANFEHARSFERELHDFKEFRPISRSSDALVDVAFMAGGIEMLSGREQGLAKMSANG